MVQKKKNFIVKYLIGLFLVSASIFTGCSTLQNSSKYELANGKYKLITEKKIVNSYVENSGDTVKIIYLPSKTFMLLPLKTNDVIMARQKLIVPSFDIDILTALLKVRPSVKQILPAQLNTNFNGNIYVGKRTDVYNISYHKNAIDEYTRYINHFGISGGIILGISNTAMNATTTNNNITSDYDGIVLQKGIAGIIAVNKLTIGLSIGFDNLLDKNKSVWLYEKKPWYGLMLGLNLN